jgi:3-mercaptopyruvate sulfurtransferase SseA
MKKTFLAISILLLATLACNAALPQAEPTTAPTKQVISTQVETQPQPEQADLPLIEAEVPRVTVEEAKAALDSGEAVIVDVRSPEAYADSHIAGAISISLGAVETNPLGLDLDKKQWIITYCT